MQKLIKYYKKCMHCPLNQNAKKEQRIEIKVTTDKMQRFDILYKIFHRVCLCVVKVFLCKLRVSRICAGKTNILV